MENQVGRQLGNYRLERLLGQGGFADVYLGTHVHLNTQAALKVLQVRLVGTNLEAFRQEARTIAALTHPHIVRVLDFGVEEASGTPFLVMDYAPNGSLRQRYPRGSILPPRLIVQYVKQVANALQYAHQKKLIHRDVKPENMLLYTEDMILLSDFGLVLAEQSTSSQLTREAAGTLPYMAPEQLKGRPRPASDQYSLGVVVYEWLCGERPFQGNAMELLGQHALAPPPPLSQRIPHFPPAVEAVVLRALEKDPHQRFEHIDAFAAAFEVACLAALNPQSAVDLSLSATEIRASQNATLQREVLPEPSSQAPTGLNTWPSEASTYVHAPPPMAPGQANVDQFVVSDSAGWSQEAPTYRSPVAGPVSETELKVNSSSTPPAFFSSGPVAGQSSGLAPGMPSYSPLSSGTPISAWPARGSATPIPGTADFSPAASGAPTLQVPAGGVNGPAFPTMLAPAIQSEPGGFDPQPGPGAVFPPPVRPGAPSPSLQSSRSLGTRRWLVAVLLLVVLLAGGLAGLQYALPHGIQGLIQPSSNSGGASNYQATVEITPLSQDIKQSYQFIAVTGTPDSTKRQVQAYQLSATSAPQSQSAPATGQGTTPGTHASGTLTIQSFSGVQTFQSGMTMTNEPGTIQMVLDATVTAPDGGTVLAPAHVAQAGSAGNIAAQKFCAPVCGASPGGTWRAWNDTPFTGGQDPQSYTAVKQSDIDGVANSLTQSLTPSTQQSVQSQVKNGERALGSPQCNSQVTSDHAAGAQASSVTVTVTVTCTLEAYDYQGALTLAAQLLQAQAQQNPGSGYALSGNILSTLTSAVPASGQSGAINLALTSEGVWFFQFNDAQKQSLKVALAGKHKDAMLSWLARQPGIKTAIIQLSGGGDLLPKDPNQIRLIIQNIAGPQVTPSAAN